MRLDQLLAAVTVLETTGDPASVDIGAVIEDSRQVVPGSLYCCVPGLVVDGHDYAEDAVAAGAVALLCERPLPVGAVQARVAAVRPAMAGVAAALQGFPSRRLDVIGVTGTNGKTTVTHMLQAILKAQGWPTGVLGTLSGARTTASAPELQKALADQVDSGARAVAMEVSSHALDQDRVEAVDFAAAVFTNLSHDHLDYHKSMESYFQAKARLFEPGRTRLAVINVADEWGRRLADGCSGAVERYSRQDATEVVSTLSGSHFTWRDQRVHVPLGGEFNIVNALAAATTAAALGASQDAIVAGLADMPPVRGRMEMVDGGQDFEVIVDFAHTPDGLERVLVSARQAAGPQARLAVVFGCGGDKDRAKRPVMGELAGRLADLAVLTTDNPRGEDPLAIIGEVRAGSSDPGRLTVEPDRRAAIELALRWARAGDVVVVAGKGHETGQEIGGLIHPFDDASVAREALARRVAAS